MTTVSIQLVTWNSGRYLPHLLASLRAQTYSDWELLVADNASTDGSAELARQLTATWKQPVRIFKNNKNHGFAIGHNQLLAKGAGEYVLLLNPDMLLAPDCLEHLIHFLRGRQQAAIVAPRLMRWHFAQAAAGDVDSSRTDTIDSLGLRVWRSRRVSELHAGQPWSGLAAQLSGNALEVFGVSGACFLARRQVLAGVSLDRGQLFDESYHSYKEDVDLAYRLRLAGGSAYCLLTAVAYHDRTAAPGSETSDRAAADNKRTQSFFIQYHSYKNHLATLFKNELWQNLLLDWPWILWYEGKKLLYFIFVNPSILNGILDLWKSKVRLQKLRTKNFDIHHISWQQLRVWWS